jgi:hypothetical protein
MHALLPGFMNSKFTPLHKPELENKAVDEKNIFATQSYDKSIKLLTPLIIQDLVPMTVLPESVLIRALVH